MIAQDSFLDICVTPDNTEPDTPGIHSYSKNPEVLANMEPVVVNIFYWRINSSDGYAASWALTEEKVLESVQYLNIFYNPGGVYFKYQGWSQFDSPALPVRKGKANDSDCNGCINLPIDPNAPNPCNSPAQEDIHGYGLLSQCERYAMWNYAIANDYYHANAMNVYVPWGNEDFGGAAAGSPSNRITTHPGGLIKNTFLHEIGHALGLQHTFPGWNSPGQHGCEHVTRDPNDLQDPNDPFVPYFNAHLRADKVVDTPAMPDFRNEYCSINNITGSACVPFRYFYIDQNCNYTGVIEANRADCQNTPYEIEPDDVKNLMSYSPGHCGEKITVGQGIRIREKLDNSSILQPIKGTLESLYEPYKGEYYYAGPLPSPPNPPLFQPGFNYKFFECSGNYPEPSDYSDITFSFNQNNSLLSIGKYIEPQYYNTITHPNHSAIYIDIDLPDHIKKTRKCYNNWNRAPIGGSVTKFNDNVFNANVTIIPQDSTSINNPNLINTIEPGLYKIEKVYDDGAVQQTVIIKDNNE